EDCCTVFTPKKPKTRPSLGEVRDAEAPLLDQMEELINEAIKNIERVRLK
ncbi:MAG: tRNA 4-thiouridine(8) synthase ThiI, partial [Clostridiales bacterium]|nr:tRNA 4-thiouridine(8) synthase ThiI [Clostridiales bacterium]